MQARKDLTAERARTLNDFKGDRQDMKARVPVAQAIENGAGNDVLTLYKRPEQMKRRPR